MPGIKRKKTKNTKSSSYSKNNIEIALIVLAAVSIFLVISLYFGVGGIIGDAFTNLLTGLFGVTAFIVPLGLIAIFIYSLISRNNPPKKSKYILSAVLFVVLCAIIHMRTGDTTTINPMPSYLDGVDLIGGGVVGALLAFPFSRLFGVGAGIFFYTAFVIVAMCLFEISILSIIGRIIRAVMAFFNNIKSDIDELKSSNSKKEKKVENEPLNEEKSIKPQNGIMVEPDVDKFIDITEPDEAIDDELKIKLYNESQTLSDETADEEGKEDSPPFDVEGSHDANGENCENSAASDEENHNIAIEVENEYIEYEFPPLSLLSKAKNTVDNGKIQAQLRQNAQKLIDTLKSFGVEAKVVEISRGPTVTRYEIAPHAGVKVSKIVNLADDIALNLAATGVRIEAPIPGKAAVGIEIANKDTNVVKLRDVIDTDEFSKSESKLSVALGKDISGSPVIIDIAKMPHLLIAGATGAGKSVCINTLITSILYKANPNEVKLVMIDPKVVELGVYNGVPHLLIPVVTDPKKAAGALNWAVSEMTERYGLFAANNVRDIKGYNELMEMNGTPLNKMPQIVIIIDELADLMMVAPSDVENYICRLAQMARAAGMHLVIATQRPSVNIITGTIKANIPSRISFMVSSHIDSRTILDMAGAEKLIGKGDMLYMPVGASKPTRLQCAFISDKEVEGVVKNITQNATAQYKEDIIEHLEKEEIYNPEGEDDGDADEFLAASIELAIDSGQISTSLLQRRFKIGYNRAGRIIDQMEARGIISGLDGNKPRQVLITRDQYNEMLTR